jgi:hypothetical protein
MESCGQTAKDTPAEACQLPSSVAAQGTQTAGHHILTAGCSSPHRLPHVRHTAFQLQNARGKSARVAAATAALPPGPGASLARPQQSRALKPAYYALKETIAGNGEAASCQRNAFTKLS